MNLTELEEYVLPYFLSVDALSVSVDGRYYRREDFGRVFEDRIFYATQQFGSKIARRHSNIAAPLVDRLIESMRCRLPPISGQLRGTALIPANIELS
jgi:hypothetical protein